MNARLLLVLAPLLACRPASIEPPTAAPSPPTVPAAIELPSEFTGSPMRVTMLDGGIIVETLVEGEGEPATEGKLVVLDHAVYQADTGDLIPWHLRRVQVGRPAGNPLGEALQRVIAGQRPGLRARVFVPGTLVDAHKPARAPAVGDVWFTVALQQVREYPQLATLGAFAGEPIATKVFDDGGIEVHDYAPGEGPTAVEGDRVEYIELASTFAGRATLRDPNAIPYHHVSVVGGGSNDEIIEGARVGMLRKYILHFKPKDKPNLVVDHVVYVQITGVGR